MVTMASLAAEAKARAVEKLFDQVHTHLEIAARAYLSGDIEILEQATANAHMMARALKENTQGATQ